MLINDPERALREAAAALEPHLVASRRNIHSRPELAFQETRTAGIVAGELTRLGIPHRTGVAFATETLIQLSAHPRVVAVKDAKGDLAASAEVIAGSDLAWYSGDDILTLPLLSVGAVGVVSVTGHLVARRIRAMIDAFERGDVVEAATLHQGMLPVDIGVFRTQAAILTKAAYNLLGLPGGVVRSPLVDATPEQIAVLRDDLARGGVDLNSKETA